MLFYLLDIWYIVQYVNSFFFVKSSLYLYIEFVVVGGGLTYTITVYFLISICFLCHLKLRTYPEFIKCTYTLTCP
jgi:hypothetical protein